MPAVYEKDNENQDQQGAGKTAAVEEKAEICKRCPLCQWWQDGHL